LYIVDSSSPWSAVGQVRFSHSRACWERWQQRSRCVIYDG